MTQAVKSQILIVDDEITNLQLLKSILMNADYEVLAFPDGSQALESVHEMIPDLVLLDIDMPNMNGFEVCEWLKSNPHTRDIPVIFVSGVDATDDIRKAFALGAVDYVVKPFNSEEIHERELVEEDLRRARDKLENCVIERTEDLAESEERFRTLIEHAADAFFLHDMDGRIVTVNQRACARTWTIPEMSSCR